MLDLKIGFIGAGQMATALAKGFVDAGLVSPKNIVAADPFAASRDRFQATLAAAEVTNSNAAVITASDIVWLAVKPQVLSGVLEELSRQTLADKLFVSIVAGFGLERITSSLGTEQVIRVMPNTPCLIGTGASGFSPTTSVTAEQLAIVTQLLQSVGIAVQVAEYQLDAVTGLSGSGPAYIYSAIEALSDGGVRAGLPRDIATQLAAQTVLGAAAMVLRTGEHPGVLKDKVTSPGGTTIAGLQTLERRAFRGALIDAVQAATDRSRELGGS